jgi:hypothetical protein
VDDQHVPARFAGDVLGQAPCEEVLEESRLLDADDDEVGLVPVSDLEDLLHRRSGLRDELRAYGAAFEKTPRLLEVLICEIELLRRG